jgi:hypothetical protein
MTPIDFQVTRSKVKVTIILKSFRLFSRHKSKLFNDGITRSKIKVTGALTVGMVFAHDLHKVFITRK